MSIDDGWSVGEVMRDRRTKTVTTDQMGLAIDRRDAEIARLEWRLQACEETRAELERSFKATVAEVGRLDGALMSNGPPNGLTITHHYADGTGSVGLPTTADIVAHLLERPAMAWQVLEALAVKVAGPWVEFREGYSYREKIRNPQASIHHLNTGEWDMMSTDPACHCRGHGRYDTEGEARTAADDALRAAGYTLVGGDDE